MQLTGFVGRIFQKAALLVKRVLQGGRTPRQLSLTLCLGTATGIMPLLWGTTILAALLAAIFKLNQAAMQAVNYLCYPLQIALFIPFCQLGAYLFPWGPAVSAAVLTGALHGKFGAALGLIAWASLRALGAWLITVPPATLIIYPLLKELLKRRERVAAQPAIPPVPES
jgi:hypothetical protein